MEIKRGEWETVITSNLLASESKVKCVIKKDDGDNGSAGFWLDVEEGGQVFKGCNLQMCGPLERQDFLPFLKQIVYEIELIDKK